MVFKKIVALTLFSALFFICGCGGESAFTKAVSYQKDGEYQKAIEYYKHAIENKERVAESEKRLGDIFFGDKKYDEAIEHYKNSIEIEPGIALDTVMKYISYNDAKVRDQIGKMLVSVENEQAQKDINKKLSEILKSKDQYKVLDALDVAEKIGDRAQYISDDIVILLDSNDIIKQKVLKVLPNFAKVFSEKYGLEKITVFLDQKNEIIKSNTIECLGNMHEYAISTLPKLIDLAVKENRYSKDIFPAIEKMGLPTQEQMKDMYSFLKDKPKEIKISMLNVWEKFGERANIYVPNIIIFLNDEDNDVKKATRNALLKIGKASKDSVPELINLLKENNEEILSRAIYELGDLGKSASAAVEPLKEMVQKTDSRDVKTMANDALQKIQ